MSDVITSTVARCKGCGRIIFAVVDEPVVLEACASDIMEMIADGYNMVHVEHDTVRNEFGCRCPRQMTLEV